MRSLRNEYLCCENGVVLYTAIPNYIQEIPGCRGFYPGESFTARYNIIAEPGTLRYFERFETCASVENLPTYLCHIIQISISNEVHS